MLIVLAAATAGPTDAAARTILGAGRDAITLRWEPASGPVAYYEVTCTVDGRPDFLVGTTPEPEIEIVRDPARWGERYANCRVQGFDADGNPGPVSDASDEEFEFLPNTDLDGDLTVGVLDLPAIQARLLSGDGGILEFIAYHRLFLCQIDPDARIYRDCARADTAEQ